MKKNKSRELLKSINIHPKYYKYNKNNKLINIFNFPNFIKEWINNGCKYEVKYNSINKEYGVKILDIVYIFCR